MIFERVDKAKDEKLVFKDSKQGLQTELYYPFWKYDYKEVPYEEPEAQIYLNADLMGVRSTDELFEKLKNKDANEVEYEELEKLNIWKQGIPGIKDRPFSLFVLPVTQQG